MAAAVTLIVEFALRYGPAAVELISGIVRTIKEGKLTPEQIKEHLHPFLDESHHAALELILNNEALVKAEANLDKVLG